MVNLCKYASPTHGMILETVQNKRFLHVEYNLDRKEFGEFYHCQQATAAFFVKFHRG